MPQQLQQQYSMLVSWFGMLLLHLLIFLLLQYHLPLKILWLFATLAIAKYTASPTSKRNNSSFPLLTSATPAYIVYMTDERYIEAEETGQLTQAEVDEGWHFCEDFDGALTNHIDTECEWCGFIKGSHGNS